MFGIVKPCRHQLSAELHREWMGHLCGLCLTLRDHHGQATRLTTNTDAVILSVLVDAQRPSGVETTTAAPCVLRGFRTAQVVSASEPAAIHAAAVSLTMAATKIEDHVLDHEGVDGRLPGARRVGARWAAQGDDLADLVGFDTDTIREAVARSNTLEAVGELSFANAVAPTEEAAATAFAHTGVLAGRAENIEALKTIGRCFGRVVYLLDAFEDAHDDVRNGRFNVLVAQSRDVDERRRLANDLFREALAELTTAFDSLMLSRSGLARALLVDQVRAAGHRVLHVDHGPDCQHHHRASRSPVASGIAGGLGAGLSRGMSRGRDASRDLATAGRMVSRVGVAAAVALATTTAVFRPENPQEPPFDPSQGQPVPPPDPNQQQPPPQSSFGDGAAEGATDCCCDGCCCCACESCDGCDGCDCDCS